MSLSTASRALDFIFRHTPSTDRIEIGFFGGEPLLEFPLLYSITRLIAVNREYVFDAAPIPPDAEVALFPPVSGG